MSTIKPILSSKASSSHNQKLSKPLTIKNKLISNRQAIISSVPVPPANNLLTQHVSSFKLALNTKINNQNLRRRKSNIISLTSLQEQNDKLKKIISKQKTREKSIEKSLEKQNKILLSIASNIKQIGNQVACRSKSIQARHTRSNQTLSMGKIPKNKRQKRERMNKRDICEETEQNYEKTKKSVEFFIPKKSKCDPENSFSQISSIKKGKLPLNNKNQKEGRIETAENLLIEWRQIKNKCREEQNKAKKLHLKNKLSSINSQIKLFEVSTWPLDQSDQEIYRLTSSISEQKKLRQSQQSSLFNSRRFLPIKSQEIKDMDMEVRRSKF